MTKFQEFYRVVPNWLTKEIRQRILEKTGVSSVTFNNWNGGTGGKGGWDPKDPEHRKKINEVLNEYGYKKIYEL